ncbi:MAG: hypothetical protein LUD81_08460 [Clostridiales bacterium]|nr:hypothetical protein [Clostridiales bacterium]
MEKIIPLDVILRRDGLSVHKLENLSYESQLGINLKKNLHYFNKEKLFNELDNIFSWYDSNKLLSNIAIDYRIKSKQSAELKYERYYPDHQFRKVFDDLLGFRSLCDNYDDIIKLSGHSNIRVADMSKGKARDDGYRGVHVYYQKSNNHYPIEIQYNTYYDRQLNNWLHKYLYKKSYQDVIGCIMRKQYESGNVCTENSFKEVLSYVLSDSKRH